MLASCRYKYPKTRRRIDKSLDLVLKIVTSRTINIPISIVTKIASYGIMGSTEIFKFINSLYYLLGDNEEEKERKFGEMELTIKKVYAARKKQFSWQSIVNMIIVLGELSSSLLASISTFEDNIRLLNKKTTFIEEILKLSFDGDFEAFEKKCDLIFDKEIDNYTAPDTMFLMCLMFDFISDFSTLLLKHIIKSKRLKELIVGKTITTQLNNHVKKQIKLLTVTESLEILKDYALTHSANKIPIFNSYNSQRSTRGKIIDMITFLPITMIKEDDKEYVITLEKRKILELNKQTLTGMLILKYHKIAEKNTLSEKMKNLMETQNIDKKKEFNDHLLKSNFLAFKNKHENKWRGTMGYHNARHILKTKFENKHIENDMMTILYAITTNELIIPTKRSVSHDATKIAMDIIRQYDTSSLIALQYRRFTVPEIMRKSEYLSVVNKKYQTRALPHPPPIQPFPHNRPRAIELRDFYLDMLKDYKNMVGNFKIHEGDDKVLRSGIDEEIIKKELNNIIDKEFLSIGKKQSINTGIIAIRSLWLLIKYTYSITTTFTLIDTFFDQQKMRNRIDWTFGTIAGILLGSKYMSKFTMSEEEIDRAYRDTIYSKNILEEHVDPILDTLVEKISTTDEYKKFEKKEEEKYSVLTDFDDMVNKTEVEKIKEMKLKPKLKGGGANGYLDRLTAADEHKLATDPLSRGMLTGLITNRVRRPKITTILKDKLHSALCVLTYSSDKLATLSVWFNTLSLAFTYILSRHSDLMLQYYANYKKNMGGSSFKHFCEFVNPKNRMKYMN